MSAKRTASGLLQSSGDTYVVTIICVRGGDCILKKVDRFSLRAAGHKAFQRPCAACSATAVAALKGRVARRLTPDEAGSVGGQAQALLDVPAAAWDARGPQLLLFEVAAAPGEGTSCPVAAARVVRAPFPGVAPLRVPAAHKTPLSNSLPSVLRAQNSAF